MKMKLILNILGLLVISLSPAALAAGHGGGGGGGAGFGSTFSGGGHFSGGGGRAPGFRPGGGAATGRPSYFYSRGMHFAASGGGQMPSRIRQSTASITSSRAVANSTGHNVNRTNPATARSVTNSSQRVQHAPLNGRTDHISERHTAATWHNDWDRRRAHFSNHRFFVFDNGFWFGLDPGFFPWDYYPYYAYDYYPYDYYPGYYADVEPYYYNEGVYSNTPVQDPSVKAVQTELTGLGYYSGPVDGIYGPTTRDAVAKYQIDKQLDVNGSLTAQTLQALGLPQPTAG